MAEFYVSLTKKEIASQIADLLNTYNKWYIGFSAGVIEMSPALYFVEIIKDRVVGCASLMQMSEVSTKIQHICVLPECRNCGIAYKLVKKTIDNCKTSHIFMTIRADNIASIAVSQKLGFVCTGKQWFKDHWTLNFGRRNDGFGR